MDFKKLVLLVLLTVSANVLAYSAQEEKELLKNYMFSYCMANEYGRSKTAVGDDCLASANAYLEKGHLGIMAYESVRNIVRGHAKKKYEAKLNYNYAIIKCLVLYNQPGIDNKLLKITQANLDNNN